MQEELDNKICPNLKSWIVITPLIEIPNDLNRVPNMKDIVLYILYMIFRAYTGPKSE